MISLNSTRQTQSTNDSSMKDTTIFEEVISDCGCDLQEDPPLLREFREEKFCFEEMLPSVFYCFH